MRKLLLLLLIVSLVLAACGGDDDDKDSGSDSAESTGYTASNPARVLRLDSYHADYMWSLEVNAGVEQALAEQGFSTEAGNLAIDYFYMDTKRNTDAPYFAEIAAEAMAYIRETQPDVVIANDNNAVRLVVQAMTGEDIQFVFCGLNDSPATYGLVNTPNVTGVLERAHIAGTFDWIERVFGPEARLTLLFDASVTTDAYILDVNRTLEDSAFAGAPVYDTDVYGEWQAYALGAAEDSDVIVIGTYHTLRDVNDEAVHENTALQWLTTNSSIPVVPFWEFSIPFGALGGEVISGETQGHEAGLLAAKILKGAAAGSLDVVTPGRGKLIINEDAVAHWNVTIPDDLRAESEIYTPPAE